MIPSYLKTTANIYRGLIAQKAALHFLRRNGFSCESDLTWFSRMILFRSSSRHERDDSFLPSARAKVEKKCHLWSKHLESIQRYRRFCGYIPDVVAKRGKEIFVVEVKSKTEGKVAPFRKNQKKALLQAQDYGFTPVLLIVPLDMSLEIGELHLRTLQKISDINAFRGRIRMTGVPSYLRRIAEQCLDKITEKIALKHLSREAFVLCESFDQAVSMTEILSFLEEYSKKQLPKDLERYSSKSPPSGFRASGCGREIPWDEWRKEQLSWIKGRLAQKEKISLFQDKLGIPLQTICDYHEWLRSKGLSSPELIAKRNVKVHVVKIGLKTSKDSFRSLKEALLGAYNFSLTPLVLTLSLHLDFNIEKLQLKRLLDKV